MSQKHLWTKQVLKKTKPPMSHSQSQPAWKPNKNAMHLCRQMHTPAQKRFCTLILHLLVLQQYLRPQWGWTVFLFNSFPPFPLSSPKLCNDNLADMVKLTSVKQEAILILTFQCPLWKNKNVKYLWQSGTKNIRNKTVSKCLTKIPGLKAQHEVKDVVFRSIQPLPCFCITC